MTDPAAPTVPPADPVRRRSLRGAWALLVLAALAFAGEIVVVFTQFEPHDCAIGTALLAWALLAGCTVLTPIVTFVQQLRSSRGQRRAGQATALYLVSGFMLLVTVMGAIPIVFADSC